MKYLIITIFLITFLSSTSFSEPVPLKIEFKNLYENIKFDTKYIFKSPSRWEKKNWMIFAAATGLTAFVYKYDDEINTWSKENRTEFSNDAANILGAMGSEKIIIPGLVLTYMYSEKTGNSKLKETIRLCSESFLISNLVTYSLKLTLNRKRPDSYFGDHMWNGPPFGKDRFHMSFPSGHTTSVFSIASILSEQHKDNRKIVVTSYTLAVLTGLSRVHDNHHWASDVFAGACIGYFTGKAIVRKHNSDNWTVTPYSDGRTHGVNISHKF